MPISNTFRERWALIFLSFWVTILSVRSFLYESWLKHGKYPVLSIDGVHIHHFIIGFFLVLIAGIVYFRFKNKNRPLPLFLLGSGLGLIFDEFTFWTKFQFNYWGIENFWVTVSIALILFSLAVIPAKRKENYLFQGEFLHKNPFYPLVSVVIPAFNEERFLPKTLRSFLEQDFKNFELIVVDNNSTDNTSEVAKKFGAKVVFEARQGVGFSRQRGFREATGEIILTTDADTIVPPDWISRIVDKFKTDKELVAFGGLYTLYSGPLLARIAITFFAYPVFLLDKFFARGWSLPGANLAIRKEAFWKVGGFREELLLCEDADISQRLKTVGKVELDPNFLVQTSGRRFKNGLFAALTVYGPNGIARMLFKRSVFVRLPTVRAEASRINKLSLLPLVFSVIFLLSLFSFQNPTVAEAKYVKVPHQKLVMGKHKLREETKELEFSLAKIKNLKRETKCLQESSRAREKIAIKQCFSSI